MFGPEAISNGLCTVEEADRLPRRIEERVYATPMYHRVVCQRHHSIPGSSRIPKNASKFASGEQYKRLQFRDGHDSHGKVCLLQVVLYEPVLTQIERLECNDESNPWLRRVDLREGRADLVDVLV